MKYQKLLLTLFKIASVISVIMLTFYVAGLLVYVLLSAVSTIGSVDKFYQLLMNYYPKIGELTINDNIYYICNAIFFFFDVVNHTLFHSYLHKVIEAGTPFTNKNAKYLLRVAILNCLLPIASATVASLIYSLNSAELPKSMAEVSGITLGIFEIFFYIVTKTVIEIIKNKEESINSKE